MVAELARSFGCGTFPSDNKRMSIYADDGTRIRDATVHKVYDTLIKGIMPDVLRRRAQLTPGHGDMDLEALMRQVPAVSGLVGAKRCVLDFLLFRDIVQDHTADLKQSSAANYDRDKYGGRGKDVVLPGGYDCIIAGLARGLDVRTGRAGEVSELRWDDHGVTALTADGLALQAARAIVTVPLGVLKAGLGRPPLPRGAIRFEPELPARMRLPIHRLGFGEALKVNLCTCMTTRTTVHTLHAWHGAHAACTAARTHTWGLPCKGGPALPAHVLAPRLALSGQGWRLL